MSSNAEKHVFLHFFFYIPKMEQKKVALTPQNPDEESSMTATKCRPSRQQVRFGVFGYLLIQLPLVVQRRWQMKIDGEETKAAVLLRLPLYEMHALASWTRWDTFNEKRRNEEEMFIFATILFPETRNEDVFRCSLTLTAEVLRQRSDMTEMTISE